MSSTFINLCNMTLRRLNEVEIAPADFPNTRGIQSLVKDAVRASISKINQAEFKWPFNAAEHTMTLVAGQSEYTWPSELKLPDWDSFQIQKNTALNVGFTTLRHMDRNQWYSSGRDEDYEAGASGRGVPAFVFSSHGFGFGITPSPNAAYEIRFRYFENYDNLDLANDIASVPVAFDYVIVDGALYHMYMFKDNTESAGVAAQVFERGLKHLRSIYINDRDYVYDRRVQFGGGTSRGF